MSPWPTGEDWLKVEEATDGAAWFRRGRFEVG